MHRADKRQEQAVEGLAEGPAKHVHRDAGRVARSLRLSGLRLGASERGKTATLT